MAVLISDRIGDIRVSRMETIFLRLFRLAVLFFRNYEAAAVNKYKKYMLFSIVHGARKIIRTVVSYWNF
ncbi:MAG TPA: hypothetical protein VF556_07705 [Pyrinomonadaceae bacterium]|jgi:hypothetical protein